MNFFSLIYVCAMTEQLATSWFISKNYYEQVKLTEQESKLQWP